MSGTTLRLWALACLLGALFVGRADEEKTAEGGAADAGFARYQTILDRMPFGEPPPNFDPTAPGNAAAGAAAGGAKTEAEKSAEEQRLQAAVRVSVLTVKPDGRVFVGFTDSSAKPEKHHYLAVGDAADGWTVKSADPDAAVQEVVLEKDGLDVTLRLGSATGGKDGKAAAAAKNVAAKPERPMRMRGRHALLNRREKQEAAIAAAEAKTKAAEAKAEEERKQVAAEREAAAAEREQQRNALVAIQEELRRQREVREAAKAEQKDEEGGAE